MFVLFFQGCLQFASDVVVDNLYNLGAIGMAFGSFEVISEKPCMDMYRLHTKPEAYLYYDPNLNCCYEKCRSICNSLRARSISKTYLHFFSPR